MLGWTMAINAECVTVTDLYQWNVKDSAEVKNISIPTQTGDGPYSYTFDFHQAVGQQFVATMYDSTGWGSGGVSSIQSKFLEPRLVRVETNGSQRWPRVTTPHV